MHMNDVASSYNMIIIQTLTNGWTLSVIISFSALTLQEEN